MLPSPLKSWSHLLPQLPILAVETVWNLQPWDNYSLAAPRWKEAWWMVPPQLHSLYQQVNCTWCAHRSNYLFLKIPLLSIYIFGLQCLLMTHFPLKCSWHTVSQQFRVHNTVIPHLYTLQCDPHNRSRSHPSPCSYYDIIDHIPCAAHYVPVTYLFCNLKFVPLTLLHLVLPSPVPSGSRQLVLCV